MASSDARPLAFILSQTRQNIQFLISQNVVPKAEGETILSQLNNWSTIEPVQNQKPAPEPGRGLSEPKVTTEEKEEAWVEDAPKAFHPVSAPPLLFKAKANWGYNEQHKVRTANAAL